MDHLAGVQVSSLEDFFEDEATLAASKKVPFLIMLCGDCIEDFDVTSTEPYSKLYGQKFGGYKSLFKPYKALLDMEIKRRSPSFPTNMKNKTVTQLQEELKKMPLNSVDKEFVCQKEQEYRDTLLRVIAAQEERKREANSYKDDRLRFILCSEDEQIREKYLLTQDALTLPELDGRNSDQRDSSFYDLIVAKFNDEDFIGKTEGLPNLHDDFVEPVSVFKGEYTLTQKKAKNLIAQMKPKILDICQRYEASGNGSNMMDSDNEDDDLYQGHPRWGTFNAERAMRKNGEYKNGDDRAAFLRFEGSELLYWWYVLDKYELVQFTTARLSDINGVSSDRTPPQTARPKQKNRELSHPMKIQSSISTLRAWESL